MVSGDEFVEWANVGEDINMTYHSIMYWVGPVEGGIKMTVCDDYDNNGRNEMVVQDAQELLEHYMIEGKPLKEVLPHMMQVWP